MMVVKCSVAKAKNIAESLFQSVKFADDAENNLEETTVRDREFAYTTACLVEGESSCHLFTGHGTFQSMYYGSTWHYMSIHGPTSIFVVGFHFLIRGFLSIVSV